MNTFAGRINGHKLRIGKDAVSLATPFVADGVDVTGYPRPHELDIITDD